MRRIVTSLLLVTILVQSSGASAFAASGSGGNLFAAIDSGLAALLTPLHIAWVNSLGYAILNGEMGRYEPMHAPAPVIPHVLRLLKAPSASRSRNARMVRRSGVPAFVPGWHRPEAIDPRIAPRDPMAMRRSTPLGGATALNVTPRFNVRGRLINPAPSEAGHVGTLSTDTLTPLTQATLPPSTTGMNHYWTYEDEPLPGIGKALANVGNGNLVVQADDLDIPERGVDLAFRRTYNSQSRHDNYGTDGSTPSVFGNGWTTTFDAHLAYNATDNIISVYDIDGARYDFCANGQGQWNACSTAGANNYTTLTGDGTCGYYWTKKTGTAYYFEAPNQPSTCHTSIAAGLAGRILAIQGRNANNALIFTYSWLNGNDSNPENLTQVTVAHSDGQSVTLTFALLNGTGPDELQSITRPDGATISYEYDNSGELLEVDRPGDVTTQPSCSDTNTNCIPETYAYNNGTYQLASANSPRYTVSARNNGGTATDGDAVNFSYNTSLQTTSMTDYGVVNFTPSDGTSTILQSGQPTGLQTWYTETFTGYGTGTTTMSDSDGHSRKWTVDSEWRVTETQEYTGTLWLDSSKGWDSNDDLTSVTDDNGYATVLSYDTNGNIIMAAQPQVTVLVNGSPVSIQPTAWFQYDTHDNLLFYCDPLWSHGKGGDYPNGSNPCTGSPSGVLAYSWDFSDPNQPYGRLSETQTPLGYHTILAYNSDGLVTSSTGDPNQEQIPADSSATTVTPERQIIYDNYGNVICSSDLIDSGGTHWSRFTYTSMNQAATVSDPDDASVSLTQCPNTPDIPNSTIRTEMSYFADGNTEFVQTPSAFAAGVADGYAYDADGDETSETHYYDCTTSTCSPETTTNWYDGADRLVEVEEPQDSRYDVTPTTPWLTRYLYDLTQGQTVSVGGDTGLKAFGNLYKTSEYVNDNGTTAWYDLRGNAFDALDRPTEKLYRSACCESTLEVTHLTYDVSQGTYGLLATSTDALNDKTTLAYDSLDRTDDLTYSDGTTPSIQTVYDPNGRMASRTSSATGTELWNYDADSRLTSVVEPQFTGFTSSATITYGYNPDGTRSSVSVSSSDLTQQDLEAYAYRADGALTETELQYGSQVYVQRWSYDGAARPQAMNDTFDTNAYTYSYDSAGNPNTWNVPGTYMRSATHDAEGEPKKFTVPLSGKVATITQGYTYRGEYGKLTNSLNGTEESLYFPEDYTPFHLTFQDGNAKSQGAVFFDPLSGAMETLYDNWSLRNGGGAEDLSYDADGREISDEIKYAPPGYQLQEAGLITRSYDAENHLTSESIVCSVSSPLGVCPNGVIPSTTVAYSWGPNEHPIAFQDTTYEYSIHWDGDAPLFVTDSSGNVLKACLGISACWLNGYGIDAFDRNWSGTYLAEHGAGKGALGGGPISGLSEWLGFWPKNTAFTVDWMAMSLRSDSVNIGLNAFQGIRVYSNDSGQWTSPDAYQGQVADPMSQMGYVWNENDPIMYNDPTGLNIYCTTSSFVSYPVANSDEGKGLGTIAHVAVSPEKCYDDQLPNEGPTEWYGINNFNGSNKPLVPSGMYPVPLKATDPLPKKCKDLLSEYAAEIESIYIGIGAASLIDGPMQKEAGAYADETAAGHIAEHSRGLGGKAVRGGGAADGIDVLISLFQQGVAAFSMNPRTPQQIASDLRVAGCPAPAGI